MEHSSYNWKTRDSVLIVFDVLQIESENKLVFNGDRPIHSSQYCVIQTESAEIPRA